MDNNLIHDDTTIELDEDILDIDSSFLIPLTDEEKIPKKRKAKEAIPITMDNFELLSKQFRNLILKHIGLVHRMYSAYPQIEYDDLYQEGLFALYQAIEKFDTRRGVPFGAYLGVAVANRLKCFCRDFLPCRYVKDEEKSAIKGKPQFNQVLINVSTLDDGKSYLL